VVRFDPQAAMDMAWDACTVTDCARRRLPPGCALPRKAIPNVTNAKKNGRLGRPLKVPNGQEGPTGPHSGSGVTTLREPETRAQAVAKIALVN
jgi:hypothetical protein